MGEIIVSDYDRDWPEWFEAVCDRIWPAVEELALRIEHVGSTAVAGLAAKPIIDLDVVVESESELGPVIAALEAIGYVWRGDLGIAGREAFDPPPGDRLPPHHLYLVVENNKAHVDHWLLADVLRSDPEAREQYAAIKRQSAALAEGDIDLYLAHKAGFIAGLLTKARAERSMAPESYFAGEVPPLGDDCGR
jgi:GrpB-like predicted nucleotidyltransferase (UPF0157 family)